MPGGSPQENWLLDIDEVACNIYTGETGEDGHLTEANGPEGLKATVMFKCAWQDRNDLKAGLLGTVDYQDGTIVRSEPFSYPVSPRDLAPFGDGTQGMFNHRLVCTAVPEVRGRAWKSDPDGTVTGMPGWGYFTYAILTAEFTTPTYLIRPLGPNGTGFGDLVNQTYCTSELRVSGEVFSPPTGAYRWTEGSRTGQPVNDANVGLLRPRYELAVTRVRMPIVPTKTLDAMIMTINATTLQIGANTVSPDAALFLGYNPRPRCDPYNGGIIYDIEMLWAVNGFITTRNADGSWNWFVDPAGAWSAIGAPNGADGFDPPFSEAEHNDLFSDQIA